MIGRVWFVGVALLCAGCLCCGVLAVADDSSGWGNAADAADSPAVTVADAAAAEALAAARAPTATREFKSTLNEAATAAFREGKITRWQLAKLRLAIKFRPDAMAEAQACVVDQAVQDGVLPGPDAALKDGFDWDRLLAFIKELIPLILQMISIFA